MKVIIKIFINLVALFLNRTCRFSLKISKFYICLSFIVFWGFSSFCQSHKSSTEVPIEDQRSFMILNLSEQVRWPNLDKIETFKIGVLGTEAIFNNLNKVSEKKRLFDKLIDVKRILGINEIQKFNVIYVNTAYEYLLKDILEATRGNKILIITEGYPTNSSMINMVQVGDTYSYDINRMYFREASLKMVSTLASYAVTSTELKEKLYKKAEQKLYVVSRENDQQKKIIKEQIKTIGSHIDSLNKKEEALAEKDNSINSLFLEGELKNKKLEEILSIERENERKINEQITRLNQQKNKIDSINVRIQYQQKILNDQSADIQKKAAILKEKNIIIDTQRKQNIVLSILSTLLLILSMSLLVAYIKNKKLNIRLNAQHIEINEQSRQLSLKNKELEQFAYITSHDLQEPLNTISSFIDIIKEEYESKFDEDGVQMLGFIKEGSVRMKKLIDELLQYSRLGRSKEYQDINCMPLLDILTHDLQSTIKNSGAQIKYNNLPIVNGNEVELRLLFQNLITNGIKFRKPNTKPVIDIVCKEVHETDSVLMKDQKFWVFSITDNGIGIAKEYQDRVFDIFQRLHSRLEYEGSGIGLAHCKKIVEAHSGKIWFTSEKGVGTTFNFSIPKDV
ncbi:YfiR/HmsC family protein [Algibacter pectinivorans]|uniref:histidine kinase n=1 Tax=Algibacter pectinivorans TaxID=870482 RepID=A0A1I1R601_9FLAO|nr:YfiR/HmsC family protein [Algibacter pectinivorans]SFD25720.1 His Kinase A (phospho-acceptor) domain-containing protein [Algibacter pectinivorans]